MDNKNKEDLINLLSQEENFEAVSVIANLYDNVLKKVIENKLFPELREIANDLGLDFSFSENKTDTEFELNHDPYGRKDFGFFFKTRNTSKIVIRYTFNEWNLNQLYWCIDENLSEKKDVQRLNIFPSSGVGFQWGWNWVKEYEDWNNQDTIKNVLNGGFVKKVKQDLSDLLQELREKNIINE